MNDNATTIYDELAEACPTLDRYVGGVVFAIFAVLWLRPKRRYGKGVMTIVLAIMSLSLLNHMFILHIRWMLSAVAQQRSAMAIVVICVLPVIAYRVFDRPLIELAKFVIIFFAIGIITRYVSLPIAFEVGLTLLVTVFLVWVLNTRFLARSVEWVVVAGMLSAGVVMLSPGLIVRPRDYVVLFICAPNEESPTTDDVSWVFVTPAFAILTLSRLLYLGVYHRCTRPAPTTTETTEMVEKDSLIVQNK